MPEVKRVIDYFNYQLYDFRELYSFTYKKITRNILPLGLLQVLVYKIRALDFPTKLLE